MDELRCLEVIEYPDNLQVVTFSRRCHSYCRRGGDAVLCSVPLSIRRPAVLGMRAISFRPTVMRPAHIPFSC